MLWSHPLRRPSDAGTPLDRHHLVVPGPSLKVSSVAIVPAALHPSGSRSFSHGSRQGDSPAMGLAPPSPTWQPSAVEEDSPVPLLSTQLCFPQLGGGGWRCS